MSFRSACGSFRFACGAMAQAASYCLRIESTRERAREWHQKQKIEDGR